MKWIIKNKQIPSLNDVRRKSMFLFLPKRIGNEIRWLEVASIGQRYESVLYFMNGMGKYKLKWVDKKWLKGIRW